MSVLVTGVGGVAGQGALRVLRSLDVRAVGTNTSLPCGGTHLCDATYEVPHAGAPAYLDAVRAICSRERVELVLPCTDLEAYHLSGTDLGVLASPPASQLAFLDKHLTARVCADAGLPFARSCLPSSYRGQFAATVVKPREGRGSREIHYDPPDPAVYGDYFVVQERLSGPELTIAFYVTASRRVHGFVALERDLGLGATVRATVTREYDAELRPLVERLASVFSVRGSCNVQAIATDSGVVPFEVNGRVSGSASIRHAFGFRDIEYAVSEYLRGEELPTVELQEGTALRILLDVVYPDASPEQIRDRGTEHRLF